jgi:nucleotide-binding universal stress UspA family protein
MARRILVPLDGSPGSETIVDALESLDLTAGAALILLHTVMPSIAPTMAGPGQMVGPTVLPYDVYEAGREQALRYLEQVAARLESRGLACECEVREGPPAETIIKAQADLGADLVAMATHGRSGLGRLFLGSVAEAVVGHVPVPVLVTRLPDEPDDEDGRGAGADQGA